MKRREFTLAAAGALVSLTGCIGLAFGDGIEAEASPAAIDEAALEDSSFAYQDSETIEIDETVEVAGQERRVYAVNHLRTYTADAGLQGIQGESGTLAVVSTPDITVVGQSVNPLTRMDHADLLEEFAGELETEGGELEEIRHVEEREEPVLDTAATVDTFAADAEIEGETITVNIHVTTVSHEGDVVVAIGAHPEMFQQQGSEIFDLFTEIEHPVDE